MEKKMTSRDLKSESTKERIIETTRKLMRKYGYSNVSIQQICNEADVSVGTLYHFFSSKSQLQEIIYKDFTEEYREFDLDFEKDSPYDLLDIYSAQSEAFTKRIGYDAMFSALFSNPQGNRTFYDGDRANLKYLREALEKFQETGKIRKDISAEQMTLDIGNISIGLIYYCYTMNSVERLNEDTRRLFKMYFDSIVVPEERRD